MSKNYRINIKENNIKGITLIALVITIVVLLILAAISISMLTGQNGILTKAQSAKDNTGAVQELEKVKLGVSEAKVDSLGQEVTKDGLDAGMKSEFGENKATVTDNGDKTFEILITDTQNVYTIEDDESVTYEGNMSEAKVDENPGILEKAEDGNWQINSIEDLVAFSYNVNSGTDLYENETVELGRSLYFDGLLKSYANENTKYIKVIDSNSILTGYIPNESGTAIKTLMQTDVGFCSIGNSVNAYKGSFNGNNYKISKIFISTNEPYKGLFGKIEGNDITIQNLGVDKGQINSSTYTGGIVGFIKANNITVKKSFNSAEINGQHMIGGIIGGLEANLNILIEENYNRGVLMNLNSGAYTGGIVGKISKSGIENNILNQDYNYSRIQGCCFTGGIIGETTDLIIKNSINNGEVIVSGNDVTYTGGIVGRADSVYIDCCVNNGKVTGYTFLGGIVGNGQSNAYNCINNGIIEGNIGAHIGGIIGLGNDDTNIYNCYNNGNVSGLQYIGGIIGYNSQKIDNCCNIGNITSQNSFSGGISGNSNNYLKNAYNKGNISSLDYIASGISCNSKSIENCFNFGNITFKNPAPTGGISAFGGTFTNCYNSGNVPTGDASIIGEISGTGTPTYTDCFYELKDVNSNPKGAIGKTKEEMQQLMSMNVILDLFNKEVDANNSVEGNVKWKKWKIENDNLVFE